MEEKLQNEAAIIDCPTLFPKWHSTAFVHLLLQIFTNPISMCLFPSGDNDGTTRFESAIMRAGVCGKGNCCVTHKSEQIELMLKICFGENLDPVWMTRFGQAAFRLQLVAHMADPHSLQLHQQRILLLSYCCSAHYCCHHHGPADDVLGQPSANARHAFEH